MMMDGKMISAQNGAPFCFLFQDGLEKIFGRETPFTHRLPPKKSLVANYGRNVRNFEDTNGN
jgi:hypothetical protein